MRGVLLDTNAVIDDLEVQAPTSISILTMVELASGLNVPVPPAVRRARLARYRKIEARYAPIPVGAEVLAGYAVVDAAVRRAGRNPRPRRMDLLIAATAVAHELDLVTADVHDYRGLDDVLVVRTREPLVRGDGS